MNTRAITRSTLGILLLLFGLCYAQEQTNWKAGVAKVTITPKEPIWMAGYAARKKPSEGVRQDIYVKALALQQGGGKTAVIVTADLIGFGRELTRQITARCEKQYGLTPDRLVLNASHSHSGPLPSLRASYQLDELQQAVVQRYSKELIDKVVDAIGRSVADLGPASLAFEQGSAGIAANRRRVGMRHLPGPVDQDVPVLSVRGLDGKLRAVLVGYACHATVLMEYQISGDWPGFAQVEIEKAHPGATALFVQGCGADSNPLPRRSVDLARRYGQHLAAAAEDVLNGKMKPLSGPLKAAFELVDLPFRGPPTRAELRAQLQDKDQFRRSHAERLLKILDRDGILPSDYPYPVQVWRFGNGLKFIALGGEPVVDYSLRLKAQHGEDDTWVAGYSNDVFAYVPSRRVLKEGGYEGGGAMVHGSLPGPFREDVEEIIVAKVKDLVERTGPEPVKKP